jgi:hypothetical protein
MRGRQGRPSKPGSTSTPKRRKSDSEWYKTKEGLDNEFEFLIHIEYEGYVDYTYNNVEGGLPIIEPKPGIVPRGQGFYHRKLPGEKELGGLLGVVYEAKGTDDLDDIDNTEIWKDVRILERKRHPRIKTFIEEILFGSSNGEGKETYTRRGYTRNCESR